MNYSQLCLAEMIDELSARELRRLQAEADEYRDEYP